MRKISFTLLLLTITSASAMERVFYALRNFSHDKTVLTTLAEHHKVIDLIIAQAFIIQEDGRVTGGVGDGDQEIANRYKIKFMPMVTNTGYNIKAITGFLHHPEAQQKAIQSLLTFCQQHKYDGLQIDIEHIPSGEKQRFNQFYQQVADTLHQAGYKVSIAVIPTVYPKSTSPYLQQRAEEWSNIFDLKFVAKYSDFVSVMAYDQHVWMSTPGPVAGIDWDKKVLDIVSKSIPKEKLSFGIPTYSGLWTLKTIKICNNTQKINTPIQDQLSYAAAMQQAKVHHATINWDEIGKVNYTFYPVDGIYQYLFFECWDQIEMSGFPAK